MMERKIFLAIEKKNPAKKNGVIILPWKQKLVEKQDCCPFHTLRLNTSSAKEIEPMNLRLTGKKIKEM